MKVLLDIKDDKAEFVMELLANLNFVEVQTLEDEKSQLKKEIKEAVENLKLVKAGKLEAKPAKDLLDEL